MACRWNLSGSPDVCACQAAAAVRKLAGTKPSNPMSSRVHKGIADGPFPRRARRAWLTLLWLAGLAPAMLGISGRSDPAPPLNTNWIFEATNHVGQWIWDTNTCDKQTCRFWRKFAVPPAMLITNAIVHITVDNSYVLFLDGRPIGRGSDWRTVTEYDVTRLLGPGTHSLAVEAFNDRLEAGLIFGLHIEAKEQAALDVVSDDSWLVVPEGRRNWMFRKSARSDWHPAIVVGAIHHHPWENWPFGLTIEPVSLPVSVHFWQHGWFQISVVSLLLLALGACCWLQAQLSLQARSQRLLQAERTRIARDIHDDLGAQLTQLLLLGEVARREHPENSAACAQFDQICLLARELSHGMDEVVWAVNARRDTLPDFVNYVCKYAQAFLNPTGIRCRLDVEPDLPATEFDLPLRRNLFLAVKEALNNAAKYSGAAELFLRIYRAQGLLLVVVEDNGRGFDPAALAGGRNGLANMVQRLDEISGACLMWSEPGLGCRVAFSVPLERRRQNAWRLWRHRRTHAAATEIQTL